VLNVITTCPLLTRVLVVSLRFSTWSFTFHHVYYPPKHLDFITVFDSSPLCRRHSTFFSFYPSDLDTNITLLRNALQHISSWLKVKERIEHKLLSLSLSYKVLTTSQSTYLSKLVTVQSPRNTRSSSVITISRPPTSSSLKITNRFF